MMQEVSVRSGRSPAYDILLLDWGIGGLSVWKEVRARRPDLGIVYVSDAGFTPYGKLSGEALADRLVKVVGAACRQFGVRDVILACNAASTALASVAARLPDLKITGMIEAGASLVRARGLAEVGVIGGTRTIEAGVFEAALAGSGTRVIGRPAQPLSALIERGVLGGPEMDAALEPILASLRGVPALLLACTHYPAAAAAIGKVLPGTLLLDPSEEVAKVADAMAPGGGLSPSFFTTGDSAASGRAAELAFGVRAEFRSVGWVD